MTSPCLCGDPACPSCGGSQDIAKLESLTDEFYNIIKEQPVHLAEACVLNTKHFLASLVEVSPLIIAEVRSSIADAASIARDQLDQKAEELGLGED